MTGGDFMHAACECAKDATLKRVNQVVPIIVSSRNGLGKVKPERLLFSE